MLLDPPIPHHTPQLQVPHLTASNTPTLPFPIARPHPRQPFTSLSTNTSPQPLPRRARKAKTPVLRCHLVQIKILENHQNGKDTHLRGLQIFARDNEKEGKKNMVSIGTGVRIPKGLHYKGDGTVMKVEHDGQEKRRMGGLTRSDWMGEATIR
jgi:anaphase-promoting complex subunit 10